MKNKVHLAIGIMALSIIRVAVYNSEDGEAETVIAKTKTTFTMNAIKTLADAWIGKYIRVYAFEETKAVHIFAVTENEHDKLSETHTCLAAEITDVYNVKSIAFPEAIGTIVILIGNIEISKHFYANNIFHEVDKNNQDVFFYRGELVKFDFVPQYPKYYTILSIEQFQNKKANNDLYDSADIIVDNKKTTINAEHVSNFDELAKSFSVPIDKIRIAYFSK